MGNRLPTLFVSHGGPTIVIEDTPARDFLKSLGERFERPRAIVIASAHYETSGPQVVRDPHPGMIYDFGGFPQELYEMVYPAPGDPGLAAEVGEKLAAAGFQPTFADRRGYDHGTWTPLILAYPEADIPVVQVSVDPRQDPTYHYRLGQALSSLRDEGVLVVGSGHITHNLRAFFMRGRDPELDRNIAGWVDAFTTWMNDKLTTGDRDALLDYRNQAPFVRENHPTDEHLMPIFFAYGAAGDGARAERMIDWRQMGFFAYDSYMFH